MRRRSYLKYLGAAGVVAGAAAVGAYEFSEYWRKESPTPTPTVTPTTTQTPAPPRIEGLTWKPTRIVNARVCDGNVSFIAEGDSSIAEAYLEFRPIDPSYLPAEAFPEEETKGIQLQPIDGAFDDKVERFSVNITGLKGGKEYGVEAKVKDQAGRLTVEGLKIPYIREYEKFLPEYKVTAVYAPLHLHEFPKPGHTQSTPLIDYDWSKLDNIISKHIDWATGYGIDTFVHDWNGPYTTEDSMIKRFMNNPLANDIKVAIDIEAQWRYTGKSLPDKPQEWKYYDFDDPANKKTFLSDTNYLLDAYMVQDQYLKVKDKPVLFFWDSKSMIGDFPSAFKEAHKLAKDRGFDGVFFYGCEIGWILADPKWDRQVLERAKHFDAISIWAAGYYGEPTELGDRIRREHEELLKELYSKWSRALRGIAALVPSVIPGFDFRKSPWGIESFEPIPRDAERFKEELKIALSYADEELKMVRIDTWNSWYENTQVEPSKEEGFLFLSIIKKVLAKSA